MKKLSLILSSILVLLFTLFNPTFSETKDIIYSEAKVISYNATEIIVTDGDSLRFGKEKIRLFGIDAPEIKQMCKNEFSENYSCGEEAKKYLNMYIQSAAEIKKKIYCYYSERDRYNRILGECFWGNPEETRGFGSSAININYFMVLMGHAVAYLRYSDKYSEAEKGAKAIKSGLWQGKFDLPEDWRRKNK